MAWPLLHFPVLIQIVETQFMAYKKKHLGVAVAGICIASGAAWWVQHKPADAVSKSAAPAVAATGPKAAAVEVVKVAAVR